MKSAKEMSRITMNARKEMLNMHREDAEKIVERDIFPAIKETAEKGKFDITMVLKKQECTNIVLDILKQNGYEVTYKEKDSMLLISWYNA